MAKKLVDDVVKARILALKAEGMGVNAIARQLAKEKLPGAASQVSGVLKAAREAANAGQAAPAATASPLSPSQPLGSAAASAGSEVVGQGEPEQEARAARGELAEADAIHERLRVRLRLLGDRVDSEFKKPAPDWSLLRSLIAAERLVRDEVLASRPPVVRKPEDDPQHLELQRVVVATLRSRVEAGRAARAAA